MKAQTDPPSPRVVALDWMRGVVMVLMTLDHAREFIYRRPIVTDSAVPGLAGAVPPWPEFATRWVTHLCAPSFVFLAGTSLALGLPRWRARGLSDGQIDRDLFVRGLVIALLELALVSRFWSLSLDGPAILQVLYAIGVGLVLMVPLRRLGPVGLLLVAFGLLIGSEALAGAFWQIDGPRSPPLVVGLLLGVGGYPGAYVLYPVLPWLSMMMLGFAFGRHALGSPSAGSGTVRRLLVLGILGVGASSVVRALDGYGNMSLLRTDGSFRDWLHMSKYPPSLSYTCLMLGLMSLILAGLFVLQRRIDRPRDDAPLLVFGQVPMFFYLLHLPLLGVGARALGIASRGGLAVTYAAALAALLVLYVPCRVYRRYKRAHPGSWVRLF